MPDQSGLGGTFWATLIGAVVGAVVGGVITFLIQINGVRVARKERLEAKHQEDLQTARLAMMKVIKMLSNITHIRSAILEANEMLATKEGAEFWQELSPFATMPPTVEFSGSESAFIQSTINPDLMLPTIQLADLHNDLLRLVARYQEQRDALTASFEAEQEQGNYVGTILNRDAMRRLTPRIKTVQSLAEAVRSRATTDYEQARRIFTHLQDDGSKRFGKDFPTFEIVETPGHAPSH